MKDLEEQHVCVKFCFKLANTFIEASVVDASLWRGLFKPDTMLRMVPTFQIRQNINRRRSKPGRPSTSTDDDHIEKVRAVIRENSRLTVREVSEEVGISKSSWHTILTGKLEIHRVDAKFVPRLLTDQQKANRVTVSQELFDGSNADENFLKKCNR
jgi:hypothetical protein